MTTILCLHGLGGTGRTMQPLADALTALGHTVHTPTLPGHGSEPDDLLGVTWNDWVDAADAAVTACGAQVVVGQSMGAAIALAVAARRRHHDTLGKLVAINCPAPDPDAIDHQPRDPDALQALQQQRGGDHLGARYRVSRGDDHRHHRRHRRPRTVAPPAALHHRRERKSPIPGDFPSNSRRQA